MKQDSFGERLNDYIDDTLPPHERESVGQHLTSCDDCRNLEKALRRIKSDAGALGNPDPPEEIWARISNAVASRNNPAASPEHRLDMRVLFALAAAVVLAVAIFLLDLERPGQEGPNSDELVNMVTAELQAAEAHYDKAIEGLEQIVAQNDGVLNEELDTVLNANLDLIEQAIAESRQAIRTEPDSTVAQESLLEALRRKVSLLQNTILLINEVRKGEGENALELIDEMRGQEPRNPI